MFKHCLIVFLVSMVPIIELRGAIPYGVGFGLPLWLTYIVAIVGNMLPVPLIYFFARRILEWGQDKPVIGKFFTFCLEKGKKGGEKLQAKAGRGLFWALLLFVGIKEEVEEIIAEEKTEDVASNIPNFVDTWQNWLKIDRTETAKTDPEPSKIIEKKSEIIDKFIEENPKISQLKKMHITL